MTVIENPRLELAEQIRQTKNLLIHMNAAPDRKDHDTGHCHWCAQCGDDLAKLMEIWGLPWK